MSRSIAHEDIPVEHSDAPAVIAGLLLATVLVLIALFFFWGLRDTGPAGPPAPVAPTASP